MCLVSSLDFVSSSQSRPETSRFAVVHRSANFLHKRYKMLSGQAQKSVFSCIISCSLKVYKLPTSFLNSFYRLSERVFSSVFHNVKVRRCKRSKGSSGVKRNPPASFVLFTKYIKKSDFFYLNYLNHSSSHYHIDLWLMS